MEQNEQSTLTIEGVAKELRDNFVFPEIRDAQSQSLNVIAQAVVEEKPFVTLELPTGAGKSGVGLTPAVWSASRDEGLAYNGAHYLTSQNSLSRQLLTDFAPYNLKQIRGKATYQCAEHSRFTPLSCEQGSLMNMGGKTCATCPYRMAKNQYIQSPLGVTNYSYYLSETMHAQELSAREFLICDEAHNIERELLARADISITPKRAEEVGLSVLPFFQPDQDAAVRQWVESRFLPSMGSVIAQLQETMDGYRDSGDNVPMAISRKCSTLCQQRDNILRFLQAPPEHSIAWSVPETRNLNIRPLSIAKFARETLFAGSQHVVMMSATILDPETFRRTLGIRKSEMLYHATPSDFPLRNRRIVVWPVGSMSSKNIQDTLPRVAQRSDAILKKYGSTKGLIHTHSYKINSYLGNYFSGTDHAERIITHDSKPGSRELAIDQHYETSIPSILMSPSMTEGLDLKDDLSRVQIITKVPYPYIDPYVKARMQMDPKWYQLQTALSLVQSTGRSVRSPDDYAVTVILDSDITRFLSQNEAILPKWWLDSIEFK